MNSNRRPLPVTILSCLYILVGTGGFLVHVKELLRHEHDALLVEFVELIAIVSGSFMPARAQLGALDGNGMDRFPRRAERIPSFNGVHRALSVLRSNNVDTFPVGWSRVLLWADRDAN